MDTIFAQATAAGKAGVSVVRATGPAVRGVLQALCGDVPRARRLELRRVKSAAGETLDEALVAFFPAPHSFTGEDVAEFHLHGSVSIVNAVMSVLGTFPECRIAEPGEFTRRALQNGKMDLTQVEGLADLIDAQTELQRQQAQNIRDGALSEFVENLRRDLVRAAALLEAVIDFADEDVPEDVSGEVIELITRSVDEMQAQVHGQVISERIRHGFEVAIVGSPNVGKSTLLNALAGRDAAITSEFAGTTRDIIEVQMDLGGLPVTLIDTAGLRDATDPVERIGVEKALARATNADLRIVLLEVGETPPDFIGAQDIVVGAKADLGTEEGFTISGRTGQGIDTLVHRVQMHLMDRVARAGVATRARHTSAFQSSIERLSSAREIILAGPDQYDIAAEEVRSAIRSVDSVVGRIDVEHLLDVIFASFCLGK